MELSTMAFANNGVIPTEFAFCAMDAVAHVKLSANHNPDFTWTGLPAGTKSLALLCHDPDVPSRGDDVNQEGRTVPAALARVDFFHWVLVDLPPDTAAIARGEFLAGPLSAADFALYPMVAFLKRCQLKLPDLDADGMLTPELRAWKKRIEGLSYFEMTVPPHWKQG